jgi:hypothetical protein
MHRSSWGGSRDRFARVASRIDEQGRAERGSQRQMQIYVDRHPEVISRSIREVFADLSQRETELEWPSPLRERRFAEFRDQEFLEAIGCSELADELKRFWPVRGPVWDGLAIARLDGGREGAVLVEAKSHPAEIYGPGSKAGESGSDRALANREQICDAIRSTQAALGAAHLDPEDWMGPSHDERGSLYQMANRLAHLHWLQAQGREAWLAMVCFVEDSTYKPTTREQWETELPNVWHQLGLDGPPARVGHFFLPGRPAEEL